MKVLVTGAGGFLGSEVVTRAAAAGHEVRALVRSSRPVRAGEASPPATVEYVHGDLRDRNVLPGILEGIDAVIHLAAVKSGDLYDQFSGTVVATENLLQAMQNAGVRRMVHCSSFALYEYLARWGWSLLDESSPLARNPANRDEYCQTKLLQEQLVKQAAGETDWQCTILRPGVIYGPDNLWNGRIGFQLSAKLWICTSPLSPLPLTHVSSCADAMVRALSIEHTPATTVLNVVDDNAPTHYRYVKTLQARSGSNALVIPMPWTVLRLAARTLHLMNRAFMGGNAKIPSILVPSRLHARCKPLRYSNAKLKRVLGWMPRQDWRSQVHADYRE